MMGFEERYRDCLQGPDATSSLKPVPPSQMELLLSTKSTTPYIERLLTQVKVALPLPSLMS